MPYSNGIIASLLRAVAVTPGLSLGLLLAACASDRAPPVERAAVTVPQLKIPPEGGMCQANLINKGVLFQSVKQAEPGKGGCTLEDGVKVTAFASNLSRPAEMTCPMAARFAEFEQSVLQPAAMRHFGRRVTIVNHAGAFTCRAMTGAPKRISEHGHGRAIDIWGFILEDGGRVSVKQHWSGGGREQAFLRDVARGACKHFGNVLTPASDQAHNDHLHLDLGRGSTCSL